MGEHFEVDLKDEIINPKTEDEDIQDVILKEDHDKDVKSSAIVKYDVIKTPANFSKLQSNTNLNLPPPNWLRRDSYFDDRWFESLKGHWAFPGRSTNTFFSSFRMASNFPDCVGEVDVVSDAENIKRLLKIPFNNGTVSMIVHRIGKTLLLDHFDIHTHLLRNSQTEWNWFRKFYFEQILHSFQEKNKILDKANRSRDHLHNKSLFSKFLHYSVAEDMTKSQKKSGNKSGNTKKSDVNDKSTSDNSLPISVPHVHESTNYEEEDVYGGIHDHQRNVIWTFEDIQMLIGSDMPIFGGGTHPAVSLRLREMRKPIKVLTGLDYWLDNLMCNVPEVIMCYHLDGIVKKYERLKTEDIPNIVNSKFSPRVVKDIAQNILSFLKTKTTKCGHTYWLFKGRNDEAVKLYDLTTLCSDIAEEPEQNPYTEPVAMLLFRVANNIHGGLNGRKDVKELTKFHKATLHKLLKDCLALLNKQKYQKVAVSANYLMADLFMPNVSDPVDLEKEIDCNTSLEQSFDITPEIPHVHEDDAIVTMENSPSVDVAMLSTSQYIKRENLETKHSLPPILDSVDWATRCEKAVEYLKEGLIYLNSEIDDDIQDVTQVGAASSTATLAVKTQNSDRSSKKRGKKSKAKLSLLKISRSTKTITDITSWKAKLQLFLCQKFSQSNMVLSKRAYERRNLGVSLRYMRIALIYLEKTHRLVTRYSIDSKSDFVSSLMKIYGYMYFLSSDIFIDVAHNGGSYSDILADYNFVDESKNAITNVEVKMIRNSKFSWLAELPTKFNQIAIIKLSVQSHRAAESCYSVNSKSKTALSRRLANALNILATVQMKTICEHEFDRVDAIYNECMKYFEESLRLFKKEADVINIANINCNMAKLSRIMAHYYGSKRYKGNMMATECVYYKRAMKLYYDALDTLENVTGTAFITWESVSWDLCTTAYKNGALLQDHCSLQTYNKESLESEIIRLYQTALNHCHVDLISDKDVKVYQKRMAVIHHRLAAVFHNSYNMDSNVSERRAKKCAAENNYQSALTLFLKIKHYQDFLRATFEEVCLHELYLKDLPDNESKRDTVCTLMGLILGSSVVLNMEDEENSRKMYEKPVLKSKEEIEAAPSEYSSQYSEFPRTGDPEEEKTNCTILWADVRGRYLLNLMEKYLFTLKNLVKITMNSPGPRYQKYRSLYKTALTFESRKYAVSEIIPFLLQEWRVWVNRENEEEN